MDHSAAGGPDTAPAHHGHAGHRASTPVDVAAHDPGAGRAAGHDKHAGHSVVMFRDRFWISLLLTVPVIVWSNDPQAWLGYSAPNFPGSEWIPAVFGTAVFLYGGLVFIRGGIGELRARQPGMMTLISLAIVARLLRDRDLVGAGDADHDHAARPLAGDALHRTGARRPGRPG